ncbi:MAG: hypothetical protein KAT17_05050, partial [Candidatus Aminicenantes bacterium]|nr:hypothetical protein [Candidatus Aminicenantes bacterium]
HINRDDNKDIPATITKVEKRFKELTDYIAKKKLPLQLIQGYEVYFSYDLVNIPVQTLKRLTIGDSSYILIELPFDTFSPGILNGLFEIRKKGLDPIIVHPERDRAFIENPELLIEMVNKDILIQINSSSILRKSGKQARKLTIKLLKAGLVHFIASDIHDKASQYADLNQCHKIVSQLTSEDFANLLLSHNPERVLQNKIILEPDRIYPHYLKDSGLFLDSLLSPLEKIRSKIRKEK